MAEYNVEINKYNGTTAEYDPLYPITKIENIIDYPTEQLQETDALIVNQEYRLSLLELGV